MVLMKAGMERNGIDRGARQVKNRLKQIVHYFQLSHNKYNYARISLFLFIGMLVIVRSKVLLNAHHMFRCVNKIHPV